jgi:hypothetical protein
MDLAPAAVDVSGLNAMAGAFGRGNSSKPTTIEAGVPRASGPPSVHSSQELQLGSSQVQRQQQSGQGQRQQQSTGLLGVLQAQQREAVEGSAGGGQQPLPGSAAGGHVQGTAAGTGQPATTAAAAGVPSVPAGPRNAWLPPAPLPYVQQHTRGQSTAAIQQRAQLSISYEEPKAPGQGGSGRAGMSVQLGGTGPAQGLEQKGSVVLAPPGKLQQRQQRLSQEQSQAAAEEGGVSQARQLSENGAPGAGTSQQGQGSALNSSRSSSVERQRSSEQQSKADGVATGIASGQPTDSKASGPAASSGTGPSQPAVSGSAPKPPRAQEVMATLKAELPKHIYDALTKLLTAYR